MVLRSGIFGVVVALSASVSAAPTIDWARGLVTAEGIGIADRHAPNPAVARGTSRRAAEAAARAELANSVPQLELASGGLVRAQLGDAATKARLDRAIAQAVAVTAQPETDGAWRVTMGVPIEAVRQAMEGGPRAVAGDLDSGHDREPSIVVVEGSTAKPAVGWIVGGIHAATIWVTEVPAWARGAPHVKATSAKAGAIEIAGTPGHAGNVATLYVLLQP
ncbi:hypothetical protein BH11MYX1_BH11MYX1_52510 [soil metagenome]